MLSQGRADIVPNRQGGKQGAALKKHADPRLDPIPPLFARQSLALAQDADFTGLGFNQAKDGVDQHRLTRARAADNGQDLALANGQIKAVMHHMGAEGGLQAPDLDGGRIDRAHRFSSIKASAKTASSMMMANRAWTTAWVTWRPSCSTSPPTSMP